MSDKVDGFEAANVHGLDRITHLDVRPGLVLAAATKAELTGVVVLGYDADGDEYFASSLADGADVLWLMERLKLRLLTVDA